MVSVFFPHAPGQAAETKLLGVVQSREPDEKEVEEALKTGGNDNENALANAYLKEAQIQAAEAQQRRTAVLGRFQSLPHPPLPPPPPRSTPVTLPPYPPSHASALARQWMAPGPTPPPSPVLADPSPVAAAAVSFRVESVTTTTSEESELRNLPTPAEMLDANDAGEEAEAEMEEGEEKDREELMRRYLRITGTPASPQL